MGEWLHRKLESYPIPEDLQGQALFDGAVLGKNLRPIFRDRDELSGSANLGQAIRDALKSSRFLVVLCSRNAARSEWVDREIAEFKSMGKGDRILALILDGEPNASSRGDPRNECFPPGLRYPEEPIAGDLRREGDGRERGFLKILAGISQLDFDQLFRRHERAMSRRRLVRGVVIAALAVVFSLLSAFAFWQLGLSEARKAEISRTLAEEYNAKGQLAEENGVYSDAAVYYEKSLRLADTLTARIGARNVIRNHPFETAFFSWYISRIRALTFGADNRLISCGGDSSSFIFADIATGKILERADGVFEGEVGGPLPPVAFFPDGKSCMYWADDGTIVRRELGTGRVLLRIHGQPGTVTALAVSSDGLSCVSGSDDRIVRLWSLRTGRLLGEYAGPADGIWSVALSPDGSAVCAGSYDGVITVWDAATGEVRETLAEDRGTVFSLAFVPDGSSLLAGYGDGLIEVWDMTSGKCSRAFAGNEFFASSLAVSADGTTVASGSGIGEIRLWDFRPPEENKAFDVGDGDAPSIAFASGAWRAITASFGNGSDSRDCISVWDISRAAEVSRVPELGSRPDAIAISPDGSSYLSSNGDGSISVWDADSGNEIGTLRGPKSPAQAIAYLPDGQSAVSASMDGAIRQWDLKSGSIRFEFDTEESGLSFRALSVSPDGRSALCGSGDTVIRVIDIARGTVMQKLSGHKSDITALAYSPDGRYALSGSFDNTMRLWDLKSGAEAKKFALGTTVRSVAFSHDGMYALACAEYNPVRIFRLSDGLLVKSFVADGGFVSACWAPDGSAVLALSSGGTLSIFDLNAKAGRDAVLSDLRKYVDYGISYTIDVNGFRVRKDPVSFNTERSIAALRRDVTVFADGGMSYADLWKTCADDAVAWVAER